MSSYLFLFRFCFDFGYDMLSKVLNYVLNYVLLSTVEVTGSREGGDVTGCP